MKEKDLKIGVALSGGGIRATIFHLGLFKWLAEMELMEKVEHISSVSGASICMGLIYGCNDYKWPTSRQYIDEVLPKIEGLVLSSDLEKSALINLAKQPWKIFKKKNNVLAQTIRDKYKITGTFDSLESRPRWSINGTTFETGKDFRFTQNHMGDYKIGYADCSKFLLSDAIAVSAGFPFLVGTYQMDLRKYNWKTTLEGEEILHKEKYIHLWDGGVYDNLGLEAVFKIHEGGMLTGNLNYIIVSNASASIKYDHHTDLDFKRLLDIAMDQVGALRTREVMDYIKHNQNGMYLKIGNSASKIAEHSHVPEEIAKDLISKCMTEEDAKKVEHYPTTLAKPTKESFQLILQHGYENAKCVYTCFNAHKVVEEKIVDVIEIA